MNSLLEVQNEIDIIKSVLDDMIDKKQYKTEIPLTDFINNYS